MPREGGAASSTAWAIVPLYPNELTPPLPPAAASSPRASCVGSAHATPSTAEPTCGLMRRSCALGGARASSSPAASRSSPASPAAGSAWPQFALRLPTQSGGDGARAASTAAASERTSIGSPSGVPVPCAS